MRVREVWLWRSSAVIASVLWLVGRAGTPDDEVHAPPPTEPRLERSGPERDPCRTPRGSRSAVGAPSADASPTALLERARAEVRAELVARDDREAQERLARDLEEAEAFADEVDLGDELRRAVREALEAYHESPLASDPVERARSYDDLVGELQDALGEELGGELVERIPFVPLFAGPPEEVQPGVGR